MKRREVISVFHDDLYRNTDLGNVREYFLRVEKDADLTDDLYWWLRTYLEMINETT